MNTESLDSGRNSAVPPQDKVRTQCRGCAQFTNLDARPNIVPTATTVLSTNEAQVENYDEILEKFIGSGLANFRLLHAAEFLKPDVYQQSGITSSVVDRFCKFLNTHFEKEVCYNPAEFVAAIELVAANFNELEKNHSGQVFALSDLTPHLARIMFEPELSNLANSIDSFWMQVQRAKMPR